MKAWCAALALLAGAPAAADPGSFIDASLGVTLRHPSDDRPGLEYDDGTVARLEVGSHYASGLMLRVAYAYTAYDALKAGSLRLAEDIQQQEVRLGVFHATPRPAPLGWRFGGGYVYADEDADAPEQSRYQRGGFAEVAAVVVASERLTLDLATAVMKLGGAEDYDAEAAELRCGLAFHTRVMDFTLSARYAVFDRESPFDEELLELRVGVGGGWTYPEGASY